MRYEKTGKSKEQFLEVVLDGARVYRAQGSRAKGAADWVVKDSDERRYGFSGDAAKAKAFFDETTAKSLADGFTLVGDASPRIEAMRAKERADAALGEAELASSKLKASPGDEAAKTALRAALAEWDAALALMGANADGMRSTYASRIDLVKSRL